MELTNFDYQITNLKQKGKKNVKVTFDYLNHKVTYELSLKENNKFKESDYLNEAKEIINQEVKSGKLEKYADKYLKKHNVKLPLFTDFEYSLVPSSLKGYKEVQVMFNYQNQRITTYAFIKETANKGKEYYLNEAKKQINAETRDGRLLKEVKAFINPRRGGSSKSTKVALACASVAALALGGLFVYELLKTPTDSDYTVTVDPNGGKLNDEAHTSGIKKFKVKPNSTWKALDTKIAINPSSSATWLGWTYNIEGEENWTTIGKDDDFTFTGNTIVKANFNLTGNMIKVTVDNNGGTWDPSLGYGDDTAVTKEYDSGKTWGEVMNDFTIINPPAGMHWGDEEHHYQYYNPSKEGSEKWDEIAPNMPLFDNILIRGYYRDNVHTLTPVDPVNGLDGYELQLPLIKENETWGEYRVNAHITKKEIQEHCKDGYEFAGFYIETNAGNYEEIDDAHKFTGDMNITLRYYVNVTFVNGEEHGILPHQSAKLLTSTTWAEIKNQYEPDALDDYRFTRYVYMGDEEPTPKPHNVDDDYEITKPIELIAHYEAAAPTEGGFITDSWAVFFNELNKHNTIDSLKAGPYGKGLTDDTFVGLTREIDVNGNTYHVRVVDEHDRDDEVDSLFTFEFVETLYLDTTYDNDSNYFDKSDIYYYLNDTFTAILPHEIVFEMKGKQVEYYKHDPTDLTTGTVVETEESVKLFPLSAIEMGFTHYPLAQGQTEETAVKPEGAVLDYYNGAATDPTRRKKARVADTTHTYVPYWLRSADINNPDSVWFVDDNGEMGEYDTELECRLSAYYNDSLAVAPAFEI